MEFIELPFNAILVTLVSFAGGFGLFGAALSIIMDKAHLYDSHVKPEMIRAKTRAAYIGAPLALLVLAGGIVGVAINDGVFEERKVLMEETYDIKLTDKQFTALQYPASRPLSSFKAFGSFKETESVNGGEGISTEIVTLAWHNDALRLYSGEAQETMEELPRSSD